MPKDFKGTAGVPCEQALLHRVVRRPAATKVESTLDGQRGGIQKKSAGGREHLWRLPTINVNKAQTTMDNYQTQPSKHIQQRKTIKSQSTTHNHTIKRTTIQGATIKGTANNFNALFEHGQEFIAGRALEVLRQVVSKRRVVAEGRQGILRAGWFDEWFDEWPTGACI